MHWSMYLSMAAFAFCVLCFIGMFVKMIRRGKPQDLSPAAGRVSAGVLYANTIAMSPFQKESAYKHFPTYAAGMVYHIGTFVALVFFVLQAIMFYRFQQNPLSGISFMFYLNENETFFKVLIRVLVSLWLISGCCGLALLLKRFFSEKLRSFSTLDDYLSNALTTLFHFASAGFLFWIGESLLLLYFLSATIFFLYMPLGKLRHALYYFFARYHLGFFYGRRGVWPPRRKKDDPKTT